MSARSPKSLLAVTLHRLVLSCPKRFTEQVPSSEQGLTLIECIVAIVVIAITVVAITPPVFLATATRIQSRRAEQANQIAQKEVDRVRGLAERGSYKIEDLPASIGSNPDPGNLPTAAKPDGSLSTYFNSPASCTNKGLPYPQATPVPSGSLIPVDVDGDCIAEYAMQVFRTDGCVPVEFQSTTPPTAPYSFSLGVRVYAYVDGETLPDLGTERANLAITSGRRDAGSGTRKPLQTIYTRLSRSNTSKALECLKN